jgi:hypothetical protein
MMIETLERTAHAQATRLEITAIVQSLQETLGQRLTAVVAGVSDAKAVGKWAKGARDPQPETEAKLRSAFQVTQLLLERESPDTVRAWFIGMNPDLDDQAPALLIGQEPKRVLLAARAFLSGN